MASIPALTATFDDGTVIEIATKPRDMAIAERDYAVDFTNLGLFERPYVLAFAALSRMKRSGDISIDLPETYHALMDLADVETVDDGDPKDSDPAPTTG